ncbi:probable C-mannosyltransferase DPY19L1 isoform X2 [Hemicordylus capensis]|uniref:probable C-mannosyltransferase DPY19L1 isoform X2 n=1 Tax=Hemicordylus capensis TaxID=884348 RepID=UPI0023038B49|nr:probable C-mannosyltransferase DPY19L1 isoform X2 [Hemicordylus capensis]
MAPAKRGRRKASPTSHCFGYGGGNHIGGVTAPPPSPPPPEEEQKGPSEEGECEHSPRRQGAPEKDPIGVAFFRGLLRSLEGQQLPGGAPAMRKGGGGCGRRGARSDPQKQEKGDRLTEKICQWRDGLRATLKETAIFARADSKIWLTLIMAAVAGILHWYHITTLFENDRHFSHLSALEREMAFRSEMGLYYSYYKTITEAPSFWNGLWMIMNDRLTEYPLVINTLKRFNLYPEVVLASWYRIYTGIMDVIGIQSKTCWTVNRGEGLSPIESCEGLGDPAYFYVAMIFLLNGLMVSVFFLYGTYLSGSRFGGLLTVACYFFNHGESTRVMWTPPLRESFSYPFLVVQMLLLTYILRTQNVNRRSLIALSVSNVFFMLPWQFAQFVLLTQVASIFGIYVVGFIDSYKLQKILYAHMGVLEVGPKYLKTYTNGFPLLAIEGLSCFLGTIILKSLLCLIFGISDDAHISNLLKAKLIGYRDFDTSIYTCAVEFDFMEKETPGKYMKTLLLPVVLIVFVVIAVKVFQYIVYSKKFIERQENPFNHGEIVYHALQLIFFAILAILIMRLKLFLTPHMCIMTSLICSKQLFGWVFSKVQPGTLVLAILAMMAFEGIANLEKERNIVGEFSNFPQEELLLWIKANTKQDAAFAGAMPTMASVKLSALRPVVNHPHYEDAGLRARTKIVYSMYSRKPANEVKRELLKLGVNYYILEEYWCLKRTKPGCSIPEIWDIEDINNVGKIPLCSIISKDSRPYFRTVFNNELFKILEVTKE